MTRILTTKKGRKFIQYDDGVLVENTKRLNNVKQNSTIFFKKDKDPYIVQGGDRNLRVYNDAESFKKYTGIKGLDEISKRKDLTSNGVTLPEVTVTATRTNKNKAQSISKRTYSRPTFSKVSSSTPNGNYTVSHGDSLWKIAHNAGISLNELMRQNPQIKNINQVIHPGDKINVNGKSSNNNTNTFTQSTKSSTPAASTTNYENIVLDDSKMETNINTTPSQEQLSTPDKLEPIKYNYKKKKR